MVVRQQTTATLVRLQLVEDIKKRETPHDDCMYAKILGKDTKYFEAVLCFEVALSISARVRRGLERFRYLKCIYALSIRIFQKYVLNKKIQKFAQNPSNTLDAK